MYISQPFASTQIKTFVCNDSPTVATWDLPADDDAIYLATATAVRTFWASKF